MFHLPSPPSLLWYEMQLVMKYRIIFFKIQYIFCHFGLQYRKEWGYFAENNFLSHIPETAEGSIDTLSSGFTQTKNAAPQGCYGGSDMNNWKGQKKTLAVIQLVHTKWNSSAPQQLLWSRMAEFPVKTLVSLCFSFLFSHSAPPLFFQTQTACEMHHCQATACQNRSGFGKSKIRLNCKHKKKKKKKSPPAPSPQLSNPFKIA